jgi:cytochrome oxidase Cu insertion factor (SCO1/SenC/PrrC family)
VLLAFGVLLAACGSSAPAAPSPSQGLVLDRPTPQHLQFVDQHGRRVSLAALHGKVVVLAPFLSLCQDECPLITAAYISLQRDVRAAGLSQRVAFVEATVDPVRDSVARLVAYQKEFGADWELWTGTPAQLAAFWKRFGVSYQFVSEEQPAKTDWWTGKPLTYDVLHTDGYILIDANGHERFVNASAPKIPNLSPKLKALLNDGGVRDLAHPQPTSWTIADVVTALSWVLGTNVPTSGS